MYSVMEKTAYIPILISWNCLMKTYQAKIRHIELQIFHKFKNSDLKLLV